MGKLMVHKLFRNWARNYSSYGRMQPYCSVMENCKKRSQMTINLMTIGIKDKLWFLGKSSRTFTRRTFFPRTQKNIKQKILPMKTVPVTSILFFKNNVSIFKKLHKLKQLFRWFPGFRHKTSRKPQRATSHKTMMESSIALWLVFSGSKL